MFSKIKYLKDRHVTSSQFKWVGLILSVAVGVLGFVFLGLGLHIRDLNWGLDIAGMVLVTIATFHTFLWFFVGRAMKNEELLNHKNTVLESDLRAREKELAKSVSQLRRTNLDLEIVNKELESFSYAVAHDLKEPLRAITGYSNILVEDLGDRLEKDYGKMLAKINKAAISMGNLIDGLLILSRVERAEMSISNVDLSSLAKVVVDNLQGRQLYRNANFSIHDDMTVKGDYKLLTVALQNLFENAWKFTAERNVTNIEFGRTVRNNETFYYIKDNGVGFNSAYADKLFGEFQRLHPKGEYDGTGLGLATVKKIISRHGGKVFAEGKEGIGATIYFSL
ncbi:MAG: hypothetical protein HYW48_01615 [Deltaproteobacteria bacterium]|nr:hypothetical protein [Deltaproteobacteria bacterium]